MSSQSKDRTKEFITQKSLFVTVNTLKGVVAGTIALTGFHKDSSSYKIERLS